MGNARTMKRQQLREQARSSVVYKYTPQQLQAEINRLIKIESAEIRKEAAKEVVDMMLAVFALSLHVEMEFGYKRTGRVINRVKSNFAAIQTQHLSLKDVVEELKKLKIEF